jgi:hypothetical protein
MACGADSTLLCMGLFSMFCVGREERATPPV